MIDDFAKELEVVSDMGKITLMVTNPEPDYNISFQPKGKTIGKLDFNGDEMKFIGEADESAKVFFDWLAKAFAGRLKEEREKEREACAKLCESIRIFGAELFRDAIRARGDMSTKSQNVYTSEERVQETDKSIHDDDDIQEYKKPWVGLTDDELSGIIDAVIGFNSCWGPEEEFARAIEAKLKEKNT